MDPKTISDLILAGLPWLEQLWKYKDTVVPQMQKLQRWFKGDANAPGPQRGILILGAGGCGKSTLGLLLSGTLDHLEHVPSSYTESLFTEKLELADDPKVEVVIPPGQEHRRASTWTSLQADVASGRVRGIIFVNCFGYHSLGDISFKEHRLYRSTTSQEEFLAAYLADRREEELRVLRLLEPHIKACPEKLWIISVINKEDLWWDKRAEVIAHYAEGEYGDIIRSIQATLGAARARHEMIYLSLLIGSLTTGRQERLAANVAGFDSELQFQSIRQALNTLEAVQQWEAS